MIANIGPADYNYEETASTLRLFDQLIYISNIFNLHSYLTNK